MIVLDASVAISGLLPEADSDAARTLIASTACMAPDVIISECVNALWKNVMLERILVGEAEIALLTLPRLGIALVPSSELADRAFALAVALKHPAYDCLYLALAESRRVPMITQDAKFMRKVRASQVSKAEVVLLEEMEL